MEFLPFWQPAILVNKRVCVCVCVCRGVEGFKHWYIAVGRFCGPCAEDVQKDGQGHVILTASIT